MSGEILAALFILAGTIGIIGVASIFGDDEDNENKEDN